MAKLSTFTRDATAMESGTEVAVGPVSARFYVTARGLTDAYTDRLWELRRLATIEYNTKLRRDDVRAAPQDLPPSLDDRCVAQALGEKCLLGIRDLEDDDGNPVDLDDFKAMIMRRENVVLLRITLDAVTSVGIEDKEIQDAAEKN